MTTKPTTIRRILVALDASPHSFAALDAAARLAAHLEAELFGLYVEDEDLLRGAELPITRMVGSFSGEVRPVARGDMEQQLQTQAARAQQALEHIAGMAHLRWSFKVARGGVAREVLAAAAEADLISLGHCGWSPLDSRRIGTTTETILSKAPVPVLLLRHGLRGGQAVLVVYDGSACSRTGIAIAVLLAGDERTPLVVLVPASGDEAVRIRDQAQRDLDELDARPPIRFRVIPRTDAALVEHLVLVEDAGVLIFPTADVLEKGFKEVLYKLDRPVLVVR